MRVCLKLAAVVLPVLLSVAAAAQPGAQPLPPAGDTVPAAPISLDWTPPELAPIARIAEFKNSFTFDRNMLGMAAALMPSSEADARQSIRKLDGVSVHLMRFRDEGEIAPEQLNMLREAYHFRGWKHVVSATDAPTPMHDKKTDLWVAMDGMDVRGGTFLVVTPKSLSLISFTGDLNPIDLLHLRGHFGIPDFDGDKVPR